MKNKNISVLIKAAPQSSGVYIFKQADGSVLYIGKARVLRSRLQNYLTNYGIDWKATSILDASSTVEWHITDSELAALLLEARLIQSYQPPFNVLLKTGHPYIYFMITNEDLPRFTMTRTKTKKGV